MMGQDGSRLSTHFGREDIARFIASVPLHAAPWKEYTIIGPDVRVGTYFPHGDYGAIVLTLERHPMADAQVTCITKPHPDSPHEHITHLGNPSAAWKWPREQVMASIDAQENTFYVIDPCTGTRANIGVFRLAGRAPYLRTYADGVWSDNLLSLNQCPI